MQNKCLNPYFNGLSILMKFRYYSGEGKELVSILILMDYLFLWCTHLPIFMGSKQVSILILMDYLFLSMEVKIKQNP